MKYYCKEVVFYASQTQILFSVSCKNASFDQESLLEVQTLNFHMFKICAVCLLCCVLCVLLPCSMLAGLSLKQTNKMNFGKFSRIFLCVCVCVCVLFFVK